MTVRDFLVQLRPKLSGELRYQAQVAAYLLDIVRRESGEPREEHPVRDLTAFCDAIRAGRFDGDETLAAALLVDAVAEVRIVRPDHLDPMHRQVAS